MAGRPKEFLTVGEVAAMLNLSDSTVFRIVKRGELKAHRIGRSTRFRNSDVEDFLSRCVSVDPGGEGKAAGGESSPLPAAGVDGGKGK